MISQLRTEHPDMMFYLSDDWEKVTAQEDMDRRTRRGFKKGSKGATIYRKYEEKREAEIMQEFEKALVDIVGEAN